MFTLPRRTSLLLSVGLALVSLTGIWLGVQSVSATEPRATAPTAASLHNPTFDNHIWYEFDQRYQGSYPSSAWLPDDDTPGGPQDWRLWFLDGTTVVESDPEKVYAHHDEGVQMRPYEWGKGFNQVAGLYQVVYDTTPCLVYEFQMYGQSRPEDPDDYRDAVLKVGIDQVGWHPDSKNDPAVHGDFPSTTVWGTSYDYKFDYDVLSVTAEALNDHIVVYTYADAPGGRYHRVLWDTGSFKDVTPATIYDPKTGATPNGIFNLEILAGSTSATVNWTTSTGALGQVFYLPLSSGEAVTTTYTNTVYLPLVRGVEAGWVASALDKSFTTDHQAVISGLAPGRSYELVVASRGLSGGQCVTWVSDERTFTTSQ